MSSSSRSDTIFEHLDPASAHSALVGVIFFTFWLGALAWDVVSTIVFDVRIIKLTRWRSPPAALHASAYLCSRWTSVAFLSLCVSLTIDRFDDCGKAWTAATGIFIAAVCSTCLVFCLRTMSIWNLRRRVSIPLGIAWLCMVGVGIAVPIQGVSAGKIPGTDYCNGDIDYVWFLAFIIAVFIFDGLALIFTLVKLNRQGLRSLLRSVLRFGRHSIEDVDLETMLARRTTAFFLVQFVLLGGAIVVFFVTEEIAYHLLLIVACQAIAASMAGRITRRAWRLTHSPPMLLPDASYAAPSYHTGLWAELMRRPESLAAYTSNLSLRSGQDDDTAIGSLDPEDVAKAYKLLFGRGCTEKEAAPLYVEGEMTYRRPSNAGVESGDQPCSQVALAAVAATAAAAAAMGVHDLGMRRQSLPTLSVSATARSAALHAVSRKVERPHTTGLDRPRNLRFSGGARFRSTISASDAVMFDSEGRSIMHEISRMEQSPQGAPKSAGLNGGSVPDLPSWRSFQQRRPSTAGASSTASLPRLRSGSESSRGFAPFGGGGDTGQHPILTTCSTSPRRGRIPLDSWHNDSPFTASTSLRSPPLSPQSEGGSARLYAESSSSSLRNQAQSQAPAARSPSQREDLVRRAVRSRLWKDSSEHWKAVQNRPSSADSANASPFAYHHISDAEHGSVAHGFEGKRKPRTSEGTATSSGTQHFTRRSSRRSFIASPPLEMNGPSGRDLSSTVDVDALRAAAEAGLELTSGTRATRSSSLTGSNKTTDSVPYAVQLGSPPPDVRSVPLGGSLSEPSTSIVATTALPTLPIVTIDSASAEGAVSGVSAHPTLSSMAPSQPPSPHILFRRSSGLLSSSGGSWPPPSASTGASRIQGLGSTTISETALVPSVVSRPRSAPQRTQGAGGSINGAEGSALPTLDVADQARSAPSSSSSSSSAERPSTATGGPKPFGSDASAEARQHLIRRMGPEGGVQESGEPGSSSRVDGPPPTIRQKSRSNFAFLRGDDDDEYEEPQRPTTSHGADNNGGFSSSTSPVRAFGTGPRRPRSSGPLRPPSSSGTERDRSWQTAARPATSAGAGGSSSSATCSSSSGVGWTPGSKHYVYAEEEASGPHSALGLSAIEFQYLLVEAQARGDKEEVRRLLGAGGKRRGSSGSVGQGQVGTKQQPSAAQQQQQQQRGASRGSLGAAG